jgi:hypothetical protein
MENRAWLADLDEIADCDEIGDRKFDYRKKGFVFSPTADRSTLIAECKKNFCFR